MTRDDLNNIVTVGDIEKLKVELVNAMELLIKQRSYKEFYTPREFADITGLKYDSVLKRCREGTLPAYQPYKNGSWLIPGEEIQKIKAKAYEWCRKGSCK